MPCQGEWKKSALGTGLWQNHIPINYSCYEFFYLSIRDEALDLGIVLELDFKKWFLIKFSIFGPQKRASEMGVKL